MKNLHNKDSNFITLKISYLKFIKNLNLLNIGMFLFISGAIVLSLLVISIAYSHGIIPGTACLGGMLLVWGAVLWIIYIVIYG